MEIQNIVVPLGLDDFLTNHIIFKNPKIFKLLFFSNNLSRKGKMKNILKCYSF